MLLTTYLPSLKNRTDYQIDNFRHFLKKSGFKYHIPSIHVAGTNGKGSTATYIARILQEAGYKVGLYTSPYFYDVNEMIEINGNRISDELIKKYIDNNKKLIEKNHLSEFEAETFIALSYFEDEKVDVAVIECGMGGELDATNVIDSTILSIITSISLEHTSFLGRSISEVAAHKAGIIKDSVPSLIGELDKDAENIVAKIANENDSDLFRVGTTYDIKVNEKGTSFSYQEYKDVELASYATYSCLDASIALEAIRILGGYFTIKEEEIRKALKETHIPNRFEIMGKEPLFIIDGGHNLEAIKSLVKTVSAYNHTKNIHIIFSCFKDKNLALMLPEISLLSNDVSLTTFDHPRARKEEDYFLFLEEYKYYEDHISLINEKIKEYPDDLFLITGSLAFAALVRKEYLEGYYKYEKPVA